MTNERAVIEKAAGALVRESGEGGYSPAEARALAAIVLDVATPLIRSDVLAEAAGLPIKSLQGQDYVQTGVGVMCGRCGCQVLSVPTHDAISPCAKGDT